MASGCNDSSPPCTRTPRPRQKKTTEALSILGSESNLRDAENALMDLFEWSRHDVVATLVKNREVIVWCTKLARSDAEERVNIEVAMREKGLFQILRELRGDRSKAAGDSNAMEVDSKSNVPKTGTIAPGSTVQPRGIVDLEAMAFSQGGHLMANKNVKLPEGSFKRSKKGYEEIHVPEPKRAVDARSLVQITDLPAWMQKAFEGQRSLNPVQTKVYPVAYGTDEPILLCAPTGAGKVRSIQISPTLSSDGHPFYDELRHVDHLE